MKKRPVGEQLLHADRRIDRQTDERTDRHDEVNNYFPQFCEWA